jgi:hypothetical protein
VGNKNRHTDAGNGVTRHAIDRMRNRGIAADVADLVLMEGDRLTHRQDRYLLRSDIINVLRKENPDMYSSDLLKRAEKACPIVVVYKDDAFVTAFRPQKGINRAPRGRNLGKDY